MHELLELNVGGLKYTTTTATLTKENTLLSDLASHGKSANTIPENSAFIRLSENSFFIDRDGSLFKYILDYLRCGVLALPENFTEKRRLLEETKFYRISSLMKKLQDPSADLVNGTSHLGGHHVTVGYRGTFAFGRDGQADIKFRKLTRILVCGRLSVCRDVFKDMLNESRDPDRGGDRYTSRLYLKQANLEQAFDMLAEAGFLLVTSCASGTAHCADVNLRATPESEEQRWAHYNEFVFFKPK